MSVPIIFARASHEFASALAVMLLLALLAVLQAQPSLGHGNSHNRRASRSLCTSIISRNTRTRIDKKHLTIPFSDSRTIYTSKQHLM